MSLNANDYIPKGLIIGLGGGAFPMLLQKYIPALHMIICDLDPDMEDIASSNFFFKKNSNMSMVYDDGVKVIQCIHNQLHNNTSNDKNDDNTNQSNDSNTVENVLKSINRPLDFVFIDVDSKDPALGLSAPPKEFIDSITLSLMYNIITTNGICIFNVAARVKSELDAFLKRLVQAWTCHDNQAKIFMIKASEETSNLIVIALKLPPPLLLSSVFVNTDTKKSKSKGYSDTTITNRNLTLESIMENWLKMISLPSDPLKLLNKINKIIEIDDRK